MFLFCDAFQEICEKFFLFVSFLDISRCISISVPYFNLCLIPTQTNSGILYLFAIPHSECCPFEKLLRHLWSLLAHTGRHYIIVKVFFASPMLKMWKFSKLKDDPEQHSLSYRSMWTGTFCVPRYPISIRVWGIVSFISNWVFPQPSDR